MSELLTSTENCSCGRSKEQAHCPFCGSTRKYGYAKEVERQNPINGTFQTVPMFRCQNCTRKYDDFMWFYNCRAPMNKMYEVTKQQEEIKLNLREQALSGRKFSENERRHFYKIMKVYPEDIRASVKAAEETLRRIEEKKKNTIDFNKGKDIINKLQEVSAEDTKNKFNVYDEHCTKCSTCMMADDDNGLCELGRNLKKAEELNWRIQ